MTPVVPFPLASAWWRQHGLHERVRLFRSTRQPTPPRRVFDCKLVRSLTQSCHGGVKTSATSPFFPSSHSVTSAINTNRAAPPVLLVSACLLGYPVTYRGSSVRLPATLRPTPLLFLAEVLWRELGLVQCVPVCPEVEWLRLSVPRSPLRLVRESQGHANTYDGQVVELTETIGRRVVDASSPKNVLLSFNPRTDVLPPSLFATLPFPLSTIDGVVLKSRSPSCGVLDARFYEEGVTVAATSACGGPCLNSNPSFPNPASHDRICATCNRRGDRSSLLHPTTTAPSPSRKSSAGSEAVPYEPVDGFFTTLLRNSLHNPCNSKKLGNSEEPTPPLPPVITSDRLLRHFHAADEAHASSLPFVSSKSTSGAAHKVDVEHTSLDAFMEHVLQHRKWRLDLERSQSSDVLDG